MELRQLRFAVVTAETGSFLAAAKKLKVKHTTLSRRITLLEQRLGVSLFERSHRGAVPTRVGAEFLANARRIIDDLDRLQQSTRAVGRGEAGSLVIGFSTSLSAGHLRTTLLDYAAHYPEVDVQAVEAGWERLGRELASHAVDVAIIFGRIEGDRLRKRFLWLERLMVALPKDHPLAQAERIYWHQLRHETFVLMRLDPGPDAANMLRSALSEPGFEPNIQLREISRENILNLISTGRFLSVVSGTAMGLHHPGVVLREIHGERGKVHIDFCAYWREDNENPALRLFMKMIAERHPDGGGPGGAPLPES